MANEFDPWETGSGLFTDYDGTVVKAEFQTDIAYQQGIPTLLFLTMEYIDSDSGETCETIERYSVGKDWKSYDGGQSIEHPQGERQKINHNVQYGRLINAALKCGAADILRSRGSSRNAEVWIGTQWHMNEKTTGEGDYQSTKNYPDKFLGVVEDSGQGKAESPSKAPVASSNGSAALEGVDPALVQKMTDLAELHNYPQWVDQVMGLTGVADHDTLIVALADDKLYSQLKG